jgi:hypothetical protein
VGVGECKGVSAAAIRRRTGSWKPDDPFYDEWRKVVEKYRKQIDEDANVQ